MRLQKGDQVQIVRNELVIGMHSIHHCFKIGEVVEVYRDVDLDKENPVLINEEGVKQYVKKDCFKIL